METSLKSEFENSKYLLLNNLFSKDDNESFDITIIKVEDINNLKKTLDDLMIPRIGEYQIENNETGISIIGIENGKLYRLFDWTDALVVA